MCLFPPFVCLFVCRDANHCVGHLIDGLIVEVADAGVARDCPVVQYNAAVSYGVDSDGSNELYCKYCQL